jgi:hypothetical protein
MVVQINFDRSETDFERTDYNGKPMKDRGRCRLVLENPSKPGGSNLGTFIGYELGAVVEDPRAEHPWWTWENPNEPLERVAFSPSIISHVGDRQMFHIFVKNGKIEHCSDCQCGC